jgi:hypothetical protein
MLLLADSEGSTMVSASRYRPSKFRKRLRISAKRYDGKTGCFDNFGKPIWRR